jgi:hypothetical protein
MSCKKFISLGYTVNRLNPTSPKGVGVFLPPSGECAVRDGGSCQSRACVGAVSGCAACGRARFDAVDDKDMVQPLDNVQVESCSDACDVESYFRDEFVTRVNAEGEKGGETDYCGYARCTCAGHDYGKNIDLGTRPMLPNGIGEGLFYRESVVRCGRGCGMCSIFIPLSKSF